MFISFHLKVQYIHNKIYNNMKWLIDFLVQASVKIADESDRIVFNYFLLVHLIGNLQLLKDDSVWLLIFMQKFMKSNPLIKTVSYGLFLYYLTCYCRRDVGIVQYECQGR